MVDIGDIRARAKELLESGKVGLVLGYRQGTNGAGAEPACITDAADADQLVWDPTCVHNLALQLVNERKDRKHSRSSETRPIAMVAKGCDSRALVVLIQENSLKREDVHIIGVSCETGGVIDHRKLARKLEGRAPKSVAFDGAGGVTVATAAGVSVFPAAEVLADRCLECRQAYPATADVTFGDKVDERGLAPRFEAVKAVDALASEDRWAFWGHQFERCIRCFACRAVCPMCYCDECVVDSTAFILAPDVTAEEKANRIRWVERSPSPSDNAMYHLVRAMHLAGRCIDCAECERVCPVNIPVRLLNNVLEMEALEAFEYLPGSDPGQPSLISAFRDGDPNDFIR